MTAVRSSCLGTRNPMSLSGTMDSVSVNHLSNSTSSHVTFAFCSASECLKVVTLPSGATLLEQRLPVLPALPRGLGRLNCPKRHEGQEAHSHHRSAARFVDASFFLDHYLGYSIKRR